ncbi:MAG: FG-GAP-like repeat-containing protein [Xanthobacteraceae bacterium]
MTYPCITKCAAIVGVGFSLLIAGAAQAQNIGASQGTMSPSGQAPFVTQPTPRVLTVEEQRMREEALQRSNREQPPVPVAPGGFARRSAETAPTSIAGKTPTSLAPHSSNSDATPPTPPTSGNAPGDMTYFLTHDQASFPGQSKSSINEPSVGTGSDVVFVSSNWDAAYSTDRGATFTFVDPTTTFPSVDGGFCCDQTVIFARSTGTMIWQLQYNSTSTKNTYRIAFAQAANVASSGWCYYDFTPQNLGQPNGANFDYPDIALTDTFLYVTARVFPASGNALGTAIWRIPLSTASQCQTINYNYNVFTDAFTFSLAQGATNTMYFFRHLSTSQERLFNWPDSSGTISWNDINVTTWFDAARSCPGPDALNWCNRNNGSTIGRTSWVAGGVIGTMWGSSQGTNHPYPYTRVARFNESTKALINEPDIWNSSFAFIYPSVNINDRGHLGGVVFYGGGTHYPTLATLIWDDFSAAPAPWEAYDVVVSVAGATAWGDYSTTRRHGANGNTWVATGQYMASASAVHTYYVWFGRQRDQSPFNDYFPNALSVAAGGIATGSNVNATKEEGEPNHYGAGGRSVWWRFTPNSSGLVTITTAGSDYDTMMAVYTGGSVNSLTKLVENDDCIGVQSCVTFFAVAGTTYRIAVDGFNAAIGNIQLNVSRVGYHAHDFNANGNSDIAWRQQSTGAIALWLLNGATVASSGGLGAVASNWQIVGQRDFNRDGKHDVLWRDTSNGAVAIWFLNGTAISSSALLGNVATSWSIAGTGDFSGDGRGGLLWRDSGGSTAIWLLNGGTVLQSAVIGTVPAPWAVAGLADFNGDGKADILWRNTSTGDVAIWFMNGVSVNSSAFVGAVATSWSIVGTGDFNGDGKADILWRDNAGTVAIWLMNGAAVAGSTGLGTVATSWVIAETGDFNADGKGDILWRDAGGTTAIWFMNGLSISASANFGTVPTDWVIQSANVN